MSTTKSERVCSVSGCSGLPHARGWCNKHYIKWLTHGDPAAGMSHGAPPEETFWSKVNKDGPTQPHMDTPCWVWGGARNKPGYGVFWHRRHYYRATRFLWLMRTGAWPVGIMCHHCDNPSCVRPDHLYDGTKRSNFHDLKERRPDLYQKLPRPPLDRPWAPAVDGRRHKLTWNDVAEIRADLAAGVSASDVARRFNIHNSVVSRIHTNKSWRTDS